MSMLGDVFEPKVIKTILKNLQRSVNDKKTFEITWNKNVEKRMNNWLKNRDNQSKHVGQLQWEAEVIEYVDFIHHQTSVHGNSANTTPPSLKREIPLLGPRFLPPSFLHIVRRDPAPNIRPETNYLTALTVIHPVYYPCLGITKCPQCASTEILWDGWTSTGAREVHGVRREERALGYQLRCKPCKAKYGKNGSCEGENKLFCFATTNKFFWEKWEHWRIPRTVPYFLTRSAATRELFDLITEIRPSTTSAGLAEHIKQLHLLEYHQRMLEYVNMLGAHGKRNQSTLQPPNRLCAFSDPSDPDGYNDESITHDLITDIYLEFVEKTRKSESVSYCKTRTGIVLSLDNTFKSAGKAVVIDKDKTRVKLMKGGILSVINEINETLAWRFCQSQSPAEIREMLEQYTRRCNILGIDPPEMLVADNCCQIKKSVLEAIPSVKIVLDVYHFLMRYLSTVVNGTRNPHRGQVAQDVRDAILQKPAGNKSGVAKYWPREEQAHRLQEAYDKWARQGSVWSVSSSKVHADQLAHVQKGCLARTRQDIASDGSRIEGSHKGWNSIQRAQPSGIEMYAALAHDFVLRRNLRVTTSHDNKTTPSNQFVRSTSGSHHINLVNHLAIQFNVLFEEQPQKTQETLQRRPALQVVESGETFGLVQSDHTESFGGLIEIKEETVDPNLSTLLEELDARELGSASDGQPGETDQGPLAVPPWPPCQLLDMAPTPQTTLKRKATIPSPAATDFSAFEPPQKKVQSLGLGVPSLPQFRTSRAEPMDVDEPALLDCEPTSTVLEVSMEPGVSGCANESHTFFKFKTPTAWQVPSQPACPSIRDTAPETITTLTSPLPLPLRTQMTRSQIIFSAATSTDPLSLEIQRGAEFFLFMDLRAEYQWVSFAMNLTKWVRAAQIYNEALVKEGHKKLYAVVRKNPRALMEKLGDVEASISKRLATNNFKSQRNSETFWKRHCFTVLLVKSEASLLTMPGPSGSNAQAQTSGKTRKAAVCSRCKTIMYPGPTGSSENHKKGYCSDGVRQKGKPESNDGDLPEWPQPSGVFTGGTHFNPLKFLLVIRELYNKILEGTLSEVEYSMEDEAFSRMLLSRIHVRAGESLFRLFDLEVGANENLPSDLYMQIEETTYLRVDCLGSH